MHTPTTGKGIDRVVPQIVYLCRQRHINRMGWHTHVRRGFRANVHYKKAVPRSFFFFPFFSSSAISLSLLDSHRQETLAPPNAQQTETMQTIFFLSSIIMALGTVAALPGGPFDTPTYVSLIAHALKKSRVAHAHRTASNCALATTAQKCRKLSVPHTARQSVTRKPSGQTPWMARHSTDVHIFAQAVAILF